MEAAGPFVRTFDEAEPYKQDEPGDARFNWLVKIDEVPGTAMARVRLKGPIRKTPAVHAFHQVYLVLNGAATVHLGEKSCRVGRPAVVVIPAGTIHAVEAAEGETIEYVYFNQFRI